MKILAGQIPEGKLWRALVLLTPEQEPGLAWRFALQLAQASNGEAVAALILPEASTESAVANGRNLLAQAAAAAGEEYDTGILLVEAPDFHDALVQLILEADIDLLLADGDSPQWQRLDRLPCAAAVIRGAAYREAYDAEVAASESRAEEVADGAPIKRILLLTAGGPNAAAALSFILPLASTTEIMALTVVPSYLGENEVAHGQARLRQLASFVDAGDRIQRKVIQADTVIEGVVAEASGPFDLVIVGATRESTIDRALFGDVVGSVVRDSQTPVAVVWEPSTTIGTLGRNLAWRLQKVIPRLTLRDRTDVYVRIRRSARPDTDFFVLIGLSTLIAALGLLLSSPAVVIGAMLVAPLMSPLIGAGMAIVLGNPRFLRLTIVAILRGALLAIFLSVLIGFLQLGRPLTPEIQSRTQPGLIDLGVALFAGFAGAYALAHSEAAAALPGVAISAALVPPLAAVGIALAAGQFRESMGALLLFTTNVFAIVGASALVFLALGFRPTRAQKAQRAIQQRSLRIAFILLAGITLILGATTFSLAREARLISRVLETTKAQVNAMDGVAFADVAIQNLSEDELPLTLDLRVRSTHAITHAEVETLRDQIGTELHPYIGDNRELAMVLTVIRVTQVDPEVPPTPTPTLEPTATATSGPTATATAPATETPLATETTAPVASPTAATETPAATATPSIAATATPARATVNAAFGLNLRNGPGTGNGVLLTIPNGAVVDLLDGQETVNGQTWQEVSYNGTAGWVNAAFLAASN